VTKAKPLQPFQSEMKTRHLAL